MAAAFLTVAAACAQKSVVIRGTIKGLDGGIVQLMDRSGEIIATGRSDGDNYEIQTDIPLGDGRYHMVYVPSVGRWGDMKHSPAIFFMADSPVTEVDGEIVRKVWDGEETPRGTIENTAVRGSKIWDECKKIQSSSPYDEDISKEITNYNRLFNLYNHEEGGKTDENLRLLKEASGKVDYLYRQKNSYMIENIANNTKNIAYAGVMNEWHRNSPADVQEKIYDMFDPGIRDVGALADFKARIDMLRASETGRPAPDFTLTALDGSSVSLSSFRGKYVLIDFWASWCGPCIREMPHIIAIYEKYKDSGKLQVIGVSTDDDETKWRNKAAELGLDTKYLQLRDGKKETGKLYNYRGIPFLVVIGPDGTILERDLRGQKLIDTVDDYMRK